MSETYLFNWEKPEKYHLIRFFSCIREVIGELKMLNDEKVNDILNKYNVHNVNVDDIPRVNFDFPDKN